MTNNPRLTSKRLQPSGRRPASPAVLVTAVIALLFVFLPAAYLAVRAAQGNRETWTWLLSDRLPALLLRSGELTVGAAGLALLISLPLALLIIRTDLPGRRWLSWLAAMPLVFPPYVGAFAYITMLAPHGQAAAWLRQLGLTVNMPDVYSLRAAIIILALFTYPYMYLLLAAAIKDANRSLEDAARSSGLTPWQVFWRVTLPLLRYPLTAGLFLVALYALSDFGAVAMLRVETFTSAIYLQLRGRFDRSAAAALSLVLLVLTLLLFWLESRSRRRGARYHSGGQWRPVQPISLGPWRWPAAVFAWGIVLFAVGLPAGMLAYWTWQAIGQGIFSAAVLQYTGNSLLAAAGTALLALLLSWPLAYLHARHASPFSEWLYRLAYTGYALPGVVVALAIIFFLHRFVPPLYGTVGAVLVACTVRFMPQSLGAMHSGLESLAPVLEEAGRGLGLSPGGVFRRILLPLMQPSLITGFALVFLNTLKELPATLLLRPAGFDTLAVRVWLEAEEGFFVAAAPAALLLVLLAGVPLMLLLRRVLAGHARLS